MSLDVALKYHYATSKIEFQLGFGYVRLSLDLYVEEKEPKMEVLVEFLQ